MRIGADDRVLVVCPHTDDEYGCLGAVISLVGSGAEVRYLAFSDCKESVPDGMPVDTLRRECECAMGAAGICHYEILEYPVRQFPAYRQAILEYLYSLRQSWRPSLVFCPCSADTHQDHQVVRAESFRAFKGCDLLGYALPWNLPASHHAAWFEIDEHTMVAKLDALSCYRSQQFRPYGNPHAVRTMARFYGLAHGVEYAEEFEVIRMRLKCE